MRKILIIRSANIIVIEKLINYINKKYIDERVQLYILIQKGLVKSFSEKYPQIYCVEREDEVFDYINFKKNNRLISKLEKLTFNEIYIPSSYSKFDEFDEIFLITSFIKTDCYILFNSFSEIEDVKLNNIYLLINRYYGKFIYLIKVFMATLIILCCYIVYYPYYKIKKLIRVNYCFKCKKTYNQFK